MKADRVVRSTCPYCGVGCQIDLNIKDDRIFRVDAPFDAAPNFGRLVRQGAVRNRLRASPQPADRAADPPHPADTGRAHRR